MGAMRSVEREVVSGGAWDLLVRGGEDGSCEIEGKVLARASLSG